MVMGSILPIVLVTLCLLLLSGDVVSGLRDGGRRINGSLSSKTVASVVSEDILQSGGGISAPGSTNTTAHSSYDSYLFGTSEEQANGGKKTNRDKHAVGTLTTPRITLFDEHHSQVSEGIRQRLEELEERFHSSHSPNFETSPSSESYSRLTLEPGNGAMELDYSNKFSLVFNETYDPPENIHRETVMENGTRLNMESTMVVHKEYQEMELSPTIVSADVKKKKKIIVLPEATTVQDSQLPEESNLSHSTASPGDNNSTTPQPDIWAWSNGTGSTNTKDNSHVRAEENETKVSKSDSIVRNASSSEVEKKSKKPSLRNYSSTETFISLLQTTTERATREESSTEDGRGGRMLVNENSTNSLRPETWQVVPSAVAPSADQGDKMAARTKTTLIHLHSITETVTTTPASSTAEWRSRSRAYPQRRPYAAAANITTSDSEEESTTRLSRRPIPIRRPPVTSPTTTTIMGLRPTWRRQSPADNATDNSEGNDLKPNRGRGSIRYGSSELTLPATATAWTLVSMRSPPSSSNTTRLVRQPDVHNTSSTRARRPATPTTQSSMQENRVSMVQVLAPLLAGGELANSSVTTTLLPEDLTSTTEGDIITTTDQVSTPTTILDEISTFISDMFTTQIASKEEAVTTEPPSNKSILNTEIITDSTTLGTDETTTELTTMSPSHIIPHNSSETDSNSSKSIETTTFTPDVDYLIENSMNKTTKLGNLEKESESVTEVSNISSTESSTEDFHSMISGLNTTTIYSEESTTVGNIENITTVITTEMHPTTVSLEITTILPQTHNISSESDSTLVLYSVNATTAAPVTKLGDVDDDSVSVTTMEVEEEHDTSTAHHLSTTATLNEFREEEVHAITPTEDADEDSLDQTTATTTATATTSSSLDLTTTKQTTSLFLEKDITKETTSEAVSSSSVSEIDWEQHVTTARPPEWDSTVSVYLRLVIDSSWEVFCNMIPSFRTSVTLKFKQCTQKDIVPSQVALDESSCKTREEDAKQIEISMYLTNEDGEHDASLTTSFGSCFGSDNQLSGFVVERVEVMPLHEEESAVGGWGVIAAIAITCVGAVCLLIFLILMVILRKRQKKLNYGQRCTPVSLDAYSLDSVSICGSQRRKAGIRASKRSYGNAGFDDPGSPSHPMGFAGLANFVMNRAAIDEEFAKIAQVSASVDELPEGAETRNRYANVIPLPETRVTLNLVNGDPLSHYINANFVRGPKEERKFYIACQAPLPSTVTDFWRMIWEQQSRAILMLTELVENGVEKCADYLPPSEVLDCHRLFGDFQVTLKKREVKEKYIISTLQLKNLETNSWREVCHLWYVGWPAQGVPAEEDTASVIAFLLEARPHMRGGPTVIHCSPGTGRTGTVIACDLCIRDFETARIVDVPRTVARIRRDRAGAVQTRDQYAFVYQVINLYGMKLTGGALDSI